jgi:hypothetical protein
MASNYFSSLPPSFSEKVIEDFAGGAAKEAPFLQSYTEKFPSVDKAVTEVYENGLQGLDTRDGLFPSPGAAADTPAAAASPTGWTFITAPEDVSWDISNQANRVDIFGTNNPPVVAGSRGMRDLSLSNALVEGFVRRVSVEAKVASLEALMNYGLNTSDGFVSVPVYQVWANSKSYGGANAYFIIKDVKVKETMRDTKGNSTRAYVDISLMQVPAYQVNSGRDQANATAAAAGAALKTDPAAAANQQVAGAAAKGGAAAGAAGTQPAAGAGTPSPSTSSSVKPRTGNQRFAPLPVQTGTP